MTEFSSILFTGAKGLLVGKLKEHFPGAVFTDIEEFDITDSAAMERFLSGREIRTIVHCAAFTSPPKIDKEPEKAVDVNIIGTSSVVKLCMNHGIKLVYISTDYVFDGKNGMYKEDDPVFPVNKYAWSKLGGECAVRLYDNSLIIRTTFGPDVFPYEKAFVDQWTSRESVSVIAKKIADLIKKDVTGVFHVGGKRKTVFEYGKLLDPKKEIKELRTSEVDFSVPKDTSLDVSKYDSLFK